MGWYGSAAFDAFTVVTGVRKRLDIAGGSSAEIARRVVRFAAAARVDAELARACCQARAVSAYLYQRQQSGAWFDLDYLSVLALGDTR